MAVTTAHAQLIKYTDSGTQVIINLKNTGEDVSISRSSNGNLPAAATTVQGLANSLGALAFKSSLSKSDVGLGNVDNTADSNKSVKYATSAGSADASTTLKNLGCQDIGYYESGDSHYMQLGYWECTSHDYNTLALLISSAFWGNQHGSCDILYMQQDASTGADKVVQATMSRCRVGGSHVRPFYFYRDQKNLRLYLYVYVTGGNSYGQWNTSVLQQYPDNHWVTSYVKNVAFNSSWITIPDYYTPFSDNFLISKTAPGKDCIWAKID